MSQHPLLKEIESSYRRADLPDLRSGDSVRVHTLIKEGDKERVQIFEGVVIGQHRGGSRASFTVRKVSYGVGVERIFPLHTSRIEKIEIVARGEVRRARLNYLRELQGKAARIKGEKSGDDSTTQAAQRLRAPPRPPPPTRQPDRSRVLAARAVGRARWRLSASRPGTGRRAEELAAASPRGGRPAHRRPQLAPARRRARHRRRRRRNLRLRRGPLAHRRGARPRPGGDHAAQARARHPCRAPLPGRGDARRRRLPLRRRRGDLLGRRPRSPTSSTSRTPSNRS